MKIKWAACRRCGDKKKIKEFHYELWCEKKADAPWDIETDPKERDRLRRKSWLQCFESIDCPYCPEEEIT
jgi:hypothetical protein